MKEELNPVVVWSVIGVVVIGLIAFFVFRTGVSQREETGGSEPYIEATQDGTPMYTPPPGIPGVTAPPGGGQMGQPMGQ